MKKYKYTKTFTHKGQRFYIRADSLEEIGRKKILKLQELEKREPKDKNITLGAYMVECVNRYKIGQSESTRKDYLRGLKKGIGEHIGDYRLVDITPQLVQDTLNLQEGRSKSQINLIYNGLKFIFSHALAEGKILNDPTMQLKKPRGTYKPRRALTPQERELVITLASKERKYFGFLLMLLCGCRPSEAYSCKGEDISVINNTPSLHIRGTKTRNADRLVPIPRELYKLIKGTKKGEYISVYPSGKPILDKNNRLKLWRGLWYKMNIASGSKTYRNRLLEPYNIPQDLTPYCLRHEYCSELARCGVDIRHAQKLMGHANIQMTANIYTHIESENILSHVIKLIDR